MTDLRQLFSDGAVAELERLVDERVRLALEAHAGGKSDGEWLTIADCADRLHVSTRTVARLIKRGQLPTCAVGRRRLVHVGDLNGAVREDA